MKTNGAAARVAADLLDRARLLPRIAWRAILIGAALEILTALVVAPLITWSFHTALRLSGAPLRVNFDLFALLLDPRTLLLALWLPVIVGVGLSGLASAAILAASTLDGRPASPLEIICVIATRLRLLRGAPLVKAAVYLLFALPVLAAAVGAVLTGAVLSAGQSAIFEIVDPGPAILVVVGAALLACAVVALWLTARWRFVVHLVAAEGVPLGEAFRRSVERSNAEGESPLLLTIVAGAIVVGAAILTTAVLGAVHAVTLNAVQNTGQRIFTGVAASLVAFDMIALSVLGSLAAAWIAAVNAAMWRRLGGAPREPTQPQTATHGRPLRARTVIAAAVVVVLVSGALTVPQVSRAIQGLHRDTLVTAHRGSALRAPENTLAAVRAAIEDGADFVEIDIQQAADGGLVLMHDATLRRTTGRPEGVWQLTTAELVAIDAGSWFDGAFAGETIPALAAVIDAVRGGAMLNIEVKLHGRERNLASALVGLLQAEGLIDDCVITSLDLAILAEIRAIEPRLRTGLILTASIGDIRAPDVDLLVVQPLIATPAFIARAHRRGQEVHVWSLNEARNMHEAIDRGADGILTPDPALCRRIIEGRTPEDDARALLVRLFGRAGPMSPAPGGWE
jgi:glycerophosphoryl diester phosphodiesterase